MHLFGGGAPIWRALARNVWAIGLAFAGLAVPAFAALDVSMTVPSPYPTLIYPGDTTAFRITLTNSNAAAPVTGAGFANTMPGGLIVSGAGVTSYTCRDGNGNLVATTGLVTAAVGGTTISLTGGTIPQAIASVGLGQCVIDVEVTSQTRNTAPQNEIPVGGVTGADDTGAVANGSAARQTITVRNLNLPEISKSFSPGTLPKGGAVSELTIVISNSANPSTNLPLNGASDTPGYAIQDNLPANIEVAPTPNASATCTGGGIAPSFAPAAGATTVTAVGGTVAAVNGGVKVVHWAEQNQAT